MSSQPEVRTELVAALADEMANGSALAVMFSQAIADLVGLNSTDLESMDILRRNGAITAGRLATLTGLTTGAITGLVDRLERIGYVRREPDPTDRRRVIVRLLEQAEHELGPVFAPVGAAMTEMVDRYNDQELALILDYTTRSNRIIFEQIAKIRAEAATGKSNRVGAERV